MLKNLYTLDPKAAWRFGVNFGEATRNGGDPGAVAGAFATALAKDNLADTRRKLSEIFLKGALGTPWEDIDGANPDPASITVTFKPWDDRADDDDDTGLKEDAYLALLEAIAEFGYEVDVERSKS